MYASKHILQGMNGVGGPALHHQHLLLVLRESSYRKFLHSDQSTGAQEVWFRSCLECLGMRVWKGGSEQPLKEQNGGQDGRMGDGSMMEECGARERPMLCGGWHDERERE